MAYKIISNSKVNPKEFVKAHMTKEEILGMEALQGHFTSIDKKSGLREFSHLIPIFKNEKVLNVFERLEDQLSEFGDLSKEDQKKYKEAETKRPHYIETATESVMKKFGRGNDKHLVLLPKEIAEFFIKINKGTVSRNPKTGYLEFGKNQAPERSGSNRYTNKAGQTFEGGGARAERTSSGGTRIHIYSGHQVYPGRSSYQGTPDSSRTSQRSDSGGGGLAPGHYVTDRGINYNVPVKANGEIDYGKLRRMRPDLAVQTTEYMMNALRQEQIGRDQTAAAEKAAAEQKSTMMSALQYGATILGYMLGGPAGASIGKMLGKSATGGFTPDMPTRAAAAALSSMTGNPIFDTLLNKIGNKIADNIPQTPQAALTQHLEGNLNYGAPHAEYPEGGRRHHNENEGRLYPLNEYRIKDQSPQNLVDEMIKKFKPQHPQSSTITNLQNQATRAGIESPLEKQTRIQNLSPFQRQLQKVKEKEELAKRKAISPRRFEQSEPRNIEPEDAPTASPQNQIKNSSIAPILNPSQKEEAIQTYLQRNPSNKLNPFEVRHSEEDLKKNAYREFFQNNPSRINPTINMEQGR